MKQAKRKVVEDISNKPPPARSPKRIRKTAPVVMKSPVFLPLGITGERLQVFDEVYPSAGQSTGSIYDLCRICANIATDPVGIFSADGQAVQLLKKIKNLLPIQTPQIDDRLPDKVCGVCVGRLEMCQLVTEMSLRAEEILNNAVANAPTIKSDMVAVETSDVEDDYTENLAAEDLNEDSDDNETFVLSDTLDKATTNETPKMQITCQSRDMLQEALARTEENPRIQPAALNPEQGNTENILTVVMGQLSKQFKGLEEKVELQTRATQENTKQLKNLLNVFIEQGRQTNTGCVNQRIPKPLEEYLGQKYLGNGKWIAIEEFQHVVHTAGHDPVKFIKHMLVKIFGLEVLAKSSLTGTGPKKDKSIAAKPALDKDLLLSLQSAAEAQMIETGLSSAEIAEHIKKFKTYIGKKLAYASHQMTILEKSKVPRACTLLSANTLQELREMLEQQEDLKQQEAERIVIEPYNYNTEEETVCSGYHQSSDDLNCD